MGSNLVNDLREVIQQNAGKSFEIADPQTHEVYVVMTRKEFQRLVYDDSDLSEAEMMAAAGLGLDDAEGWGAAGMEGYDRNDSPPGS